MARDFAYFISGEDGPGIGVLVLHSFWGLTPSVKGLANDLSDHGYTVLAPDINFGELPASEQEGLDHLGRADPNRLASLVLSSAKLLHDRSRSGPIGIIGFGMGGSLGLWASVRLADLVGAAVSYYGSQQIDFAGSKSAYLIHLADDDEYVSNDEAAFMEATMRLENLSVEIDRYPGTRHGFAEPDGDTFDPGACDRAWDRTMRFLEGRLASQRVDDAN
ncbi:MAG: dienelactone hydrolase family protein [Acidimicrobiia bacterium]